MLAADGAEIENTYQHDPNNKYPEQPPKRPVLPGIYSRGGQNLTCGRRSVV